MTEAREPRSALGQMAHAWIDIERTYRWLLAEERERNRVLLWERDEARWVASYWRDDSSWYDGEQRFPWEALTPDD